MFKLIQKIRNLSSINNDESNQEKQDITSGEDKKKEKNYHTCYIAATQADSKKYNNIIDDDRADYPSHTVLSLNAKGHPSTRAGPGVISKGVGPYLGSYPVNLDGLTDDNIPEKCQIDECGNPVNNSCIVEMNGWDATTRTETDVYHVCESHDGEDVMNDKIYEKCANCEEHYHPKSIPFYRSVQVVYDRKDYNLCFKCLANLCETPRKKKWDDAKDHIEHRLSSIGEYNSDSRAEKRNAKIHKMREWAKQAASNFEEKNNI